MSNLDSGARDLPERKPGPPPALPGRPPENPFREDVEIIDAEYVAGQLPLGLSAFPQPPFGESPFRSPPLSKGPVEQTFHVPKRFGMSAILGITTALAVLFGLFRAFGAPEVMYLYFGLLSMVICIVQMRFGDVPRQASIVAGAVMLPIFLIGMAMFVAGRYGGEFMCLVLFSIPLGGFLGYVTGTFAGGVFLLMDMFEKYWTGKPMGGGGRSAA
jgi:hypothetical protein